MKRAVSYNDVAAFVSMPLSSSHIESNSSDDDEESKSFPMKKLAIVMVGLPARGKTHIARYIARYLNWLGRTTRVFNVGNYRRELVGASQPAQFFDPNNQEGRQARWELAIKCLDDMIAWLKHQHGQVGIYDATNNTKERRKYVKERLEAECIRVLFLESICEDKSIIEHNVMETKLRMPDYQNMDPETAVEDFQRRIANYEVANETIEDDEMVSYIKIINLGRTIVLHQLTGYLQGKLVSYLMNMHTLPRSIYLTRHGESEYNVEERLGGDPELTPKGQLYAVQLAQYIHKEFTAQGKELPLIWTSQLRRSRHTVQFIPTHNICWRALNEINAGLCEGKTLNDVKQLYPKIYEDRMKDKLHFRYPGGESYVDVIQRLEPVMLEMERLRESILIVSHNAVIRAIYGFLIGKRQEECPNLEVPLHVVIKLTPRAYGCEEARIELNPHEELLSDSPSAPSSNVYSDAIPKQVYFGSSENSFSDGNKN
ncbi:6-phosphofructo-2-kinase/fructose-2,6-bisphosphatase [Galdieria sulphuraria]|uniref:Bifunctional 6-phosphofructo-2-kinase / fructose-2,6-bisphosphatase n=1 Tax=Galdieria sulphuraria TaxID=130081 RepID=M2XWT8_GALSU|nr:bifunctional 6-phosphofructo-2-kinase / fructose-2,6-bisphosphatase [Galdieria sulphuraria]EME27879.1 bifunctional 6-phosphofructo-2-kinase / fructose-2,6-bisphosphatase [Galdieria sulphuraria]GJD07791.1 6-phosphofructo-2-kinase/fructose-2,6-bisphosphatase [Galdieria sulphuraria]|eukprot:XP_005704399.1 bifunctional 6-phosphofructo-2-kinase / fructose-2,6-bisphosphatase [Galdieria sulphuraria]